MDGKAVRGEPEVRSVSDEVEPSDPEESANSLEALRAERRKKRDELAADGVDVYPYRYDRTATASELHSRFESLEPEARTGMSVRVAGRVMAMRGHGRLSFATVMDVTGSIQLMLQESLLSEKAKDVLAHLDLGDWVGAEGEVVTSRRGELSVDAVDLQLLTKALRPPPDKWHGLSDTDTRYRQREMDLVSNHDTRRTFDIRHRTVATFRRVLDDAAFVEVETPILQLQAGGAIARPFLTQANALDIELSLRIAPELYLKRLIVGGYERVFEIGRNFRNEGISTRHSPEFTTLEAYQAFGDVHDAMDLTERLIVAAAEQATGKMSFDMAGRHVELSPPWPRRPLLDWIEEIVGVRLHPNDPVDEVREHCRRLDVDFLPEWGSGKLIFEIYDTVLLPLTRDPVFVVGFPVEVSPLARQSPDDPTLADRFELCSDGRELANGYSELNIPEEQEERFLREAKAAAQGDLEAHPADAAFVRALEYGLPPTAGLGIGIDRLVMLLAEVEAIRDVILFPMLRPEAAT